MVNYCPLGFTKPTKNISQLNTLSMLLNLLANENMFANAIARHKRNDKAEYRNVYIQIYVFVCSAFDVGLVANFNLFTC